MTHTETLADFNREHDRLTGMANAAIATNQPELAIEYTDERARLIAQHEQATCRHAENIQHAGHCSYCGEALYPEFTPQPVPGIGEKIDAEIATWDAQRAATVQENRPFAVEILQPPSCDSVGENWQTRTTFTNKQDATQELVFVRKHRAARLTYRGRVLDHAFIA